MITSIGKTFIKRFMSNNSNTLVGAISVGVGNTAPTTVDDRMQFEFARVPVQVISYDYTNDNLIFKATLPENAGGQIYEVGIWTAEVNTTAGSQSSTVLTSFDSETEEWTNGTYDTVGARIGSDALKHAPAASATVSSVMSGLNIDLSDYSTADQLVIAFNNQNANAASVEYRLRTDASNYYKFTITNPPTGYRITPAVIGSAVAVGSPAWADINEIEVITVAKAAGSASVVYDGIRVEDIDSVSPEYGLVARSVLSAPIKKEEGIVQDIEYALRVTI